MKSCLLTMSEKLVWSKVRTNSFDSASSALILVNDDEAKIVKANRKKQIETLIAIAEFCVCVCALKKSERFGGFLRHSKRVEKERDKHGSAKHVIFFFVISYSR